MARLVDDLNARVARRREAGARIAPDDAPLAGWRRAYVYDPFGDRRERMEKNAG